MMMKFKFLCAMLTTCTISGFAQADYMIGIKGDTLRGEITIIQGDPIDHVNLVSKRKKTSFTALQIRSIYQSNVLYRPISFENKLHFMKVLKDGFLSYYAFFTISPTNWDGRYLGKRDGTGIEVPNLAFKKRMSLFLADCESVTSSIENGDLAKRDIEQIVDAYNACLELKTATRPQPKPVTNFNSSNVEIIQSLITKVEAENFLTKKDALDMLKDFQAKVGRNEAVPNYMLDGLRSYLADTPELAKALEAVIDSMKK